MKQDIKELVWKFLIEAFALVFHVEEMWMLLSNFGSVPSFVNEFTFSYGQVFQSFFTLLMQVKLDPHQHFFGGT